MKVMHSSWLSFIFKHLIPGAAEALVAFAVFKTVVGYLLIPGGFDSHMLPPKARGDLSDEI